MPLQSLKNRGFINGIRLMQHQNKHVREKIDVSIQNHLNEKKCKEMFIISRSIYFYDYVCVYDYAYVREWA